ncbi:MAG: HYR domain-containing protein, partial [Bacteroidota bacterium]
SSTANATVTVVDTVSPSASAQNITVYLDGSGNASITAADIDNGSSDNCSVASLAANITNFTCSDIGVNPVVLTVTDASSNMASANAIVTVVDTVSPTAVAQDITVYLDGAGSATIVAADIDGGSSDNCSVASLLADITSFTCANLGANTVELTVTDGSGNTAKANATVTVEDTISPTAVAQNLTVYLNGTGNVSITTTDVDNGSSDNCGISSLGLDISSFTCAEVGANTVELTVTDVNGNSNSVNATVTVVDTISPTAVTQDITAYLDASGNVSITTGNIDNGSADDCGIDNLSLDISSFTCTELGANTVELTVTDVNSNSNSATASVTVMDTISPTVAVQNVTIYLDGAGSASISTGDIDNGSSDNCTIDNMALDITSFSCADVGANTVVLTVSDVNGNSSMANATVTVMDTISPTVSAQNITAYLDGTGNASITPADVDNGSSDNCGLDTMTLDISSFTCAEIGANTVELTVTDVNGNSNAAIASITVVDTVSPTVITQDITVYLDASGLAFITAADIDGGSSDACGIDMKGLNDTNFGCGDIGANTVTLTVTDIHGNSSMAMATVTVEDSTAPTPIANDITVQLDAAGNASISTSDIEGASSDNCGVASSSLDITSFSCTDTGANTVTLTVTDVNGNVATTTATVTVEDTIAPVALAQDITVHLDSSGQVIISTTDIDNGSSDNCSFNLSLDITAFDCSHIGANTVVLTATDAAGNAHSANAMVNVEDTIAPVIVITTDTLVVSLDSTGNAVVEFPDIDIASYDNCFGLPILSGPQIGANATAGTQGVGISSDVNIYGIDTAYLSPSTFTCADLGLNEIILTVVDSVGNTSTDTTYVMIIDSVAPVITCPSDIIVDNDSATCGAIVSYTVPNSDNCTVDTFTQVAGIASGMEFPVGITTNTFRAVDGSGNVSTCSFTVTVNDTEAPIIRYPTMPTLMANDPDLSSLVQTWIDSISASDNCVCPNLKDSVSVDTSASWVTLPASGSAPDTLLKTYVISVNDCNGNNTTEAKDLKILEPKPMVVTCDLENWGGSSMDTYNHALYIYDSPLDPTRTQGNDTEYQRFLWDANGGTLTILNDTAAVIRGMVYSKVDTTAKFNVFIDMNIPEDWTGWQALGGGYHVPLDPTQAAVTHAMHMDWRYWELGPDSRLEGVGSIAGTLYLTQAPDPTTTPWGDRYRVQEGEGANDKDADKGVSGWFFFKGTVTYGSQTLTLDSKGDVNADIGNSDTTYGAPVVSPFITALSTSASQTQEGEGAVSLAWVSEVPFNEGRVSVERSVDGTIYEEVATIEENETGKKQEPVRFVDTDVDGALKYYYRIKVENADGSYYFTQTFEVLMDEINESSIGIFPNPATGGFVDVFVLHPENKVHTYQILDMKGSILRVDELRANQLTRISLKDMAAGIYMVQVIKPNGELSVHKIQVE